MTNIIDKSYLFPEFKDTGEVKTAHISPDGKYRYSLERDWSGCRRYSRPYMLFIGINPSTADAEADDATIRKCRGFAKLAGFERFFMGNLYAYRTTDWKKLLSLSQDERIGILADRTLFNLASRAEMVVAAWGNLHDKDGLCVQRAAFVESELRKRGQLYVLGLTREDYPVHPSRFRYGLSVLWEITVSNVI